jgi:HNH endonuclease
MTTLERFHTHVQVDPMTGCHVWTGAVNDKGYGQFSVRRTPEERAKCPRGGNKRVLAHKWLFEYYNGPTPVGYEVDHKCVNPTCVKYHPTPVDNDVVHLQCITKAKNLALRGSIHLD